MKHAVLRALALATALLLVALSGLTGCSRGGKTLLSLNKDGIKVTISVNHYQLLLSRLKGSFVELGYTNESNQTADSDAFWDLQDTFDGQLLSYDDFYRGLVLDNCRTYLAALWLFESRGLSLSKAQTEEVDEEMEILLRDNASGSKVKLNALLADYGVNYDLLRDAYLTDKKVEVLKTDLYGANASGLGTGVKDDYLNRNYLHFKQIFLANYDYVYETDANGDEIYFHTESGSIAYDTSAYPAFNGADPLLDANGQRVYYKVQNDPSHIAYDTETGERSIANDSNGNPIKKPLPDSELTGLESRAESLFDSLIGATEEKFDEAAKKNGLTSEFTDGYYLLKGADYSSVGSDLAFLSVVSLALDSMNDGEIRMLESDSGYHIIQKLQPTSGAYNKEVNEVWFSNFNDNLTEELFLAECEKLFPDIKLEESVYATVPKLRDVIPNSVF